jgi:hypothetical protein
MASYTCIEPGSPGEEILAVDIEIEFTHPAFDDPRMITERFGDEADDVILVDCVLPDDNGGEGRAPTVVEGSPTPVDANIDVASAVIRESFTPGTEAYAAGQEGQIAPLDENLEPSVTLKLTDFNLFALDGVSSNNLIAFGFGGAGGAGILQGTSDQDLQDFRIFDMAEGNHTDVVTDFELPAELGLPGAALGFNGFTNKNHVFAHFDNAEGRYVMNQQLSGLATPDDWGGLATIGFQTGTRWDFNNPLLAVSDPLNGDQGNVYVLLWNGLGSADPVVGVETMLAPNNAIRLRCSDEQEAAGNRLCAITSSSVNSLRLFRWDSELTDQTDMTEVENSVEFVANIAGTFTVTPAIRMFDDGLFRVVGGRNDGTNPNITRVTVCADYSTERNFETVDGIQEINHLQFTNDGSSVIASGFDDSGQSVITQIQTPLSDFPVCDE